MFKVRLIVEPSIDLGRFRDLLKDVNAIDLIHQPPHVKFERAVDKLLDSDALGFKHLFYGFYFELPYTTMLDLQNYDAFAYFRLTLVIENVMCHGIITAPLDMWRDVIRWAEGRTFIEPLTQAVARLLSCSIEKRA